MSKDWSSASIWTRGSKSPRNMSLIQVELQGGPRISPCFPNNHGSIQPGILQGLEFPQVLETSKSLSLQFLPTNICVFLVDWNFDEYIWISNITIFEGRHVLYPLLWVSVVSDFKGCNLFFFKEHENSDIDIAVLNIGYRCIHGFKNIQIYWKFKFKNLCYLCYPFFLEVSRIFITFQNFQKSRIE